MGRGCCLMSEGALGVVLRHWATLFQGVLWYRRLRRRWGIVGNWLGTFHRDKSTLRATRTWWHRTGLKLQEIKAAGAPWASASAKAPTDGRRAPERSFGSAFEPEQEPSSPPYGGSTGSSSAGTGGPSVNVQVHITVNNAGTTFTGNSAPDGRRGAPAGRGNGGRGFRRGR